MAARSLVLLSNDDGYLAEGLCVLADSLGRRVDVYVCAPESEQSTTSHSLTLTRPLRLRQVSSRVFAVDGTPADCVCVALNSGNRVLPRRPDLVVSGINHGLNLGSDVFYSGTVAAAREGALRGVPAIAISAALGADREEAAELCAALALALIAHSDPVAAAVDPNTVAWRMNNWTAPAPLLNVNVPAGRSWQVEATRLGLRVYDDVVEFRHDPRGREYLWLGGGGVRHGEAPGSDTDAYDRGVVSVTPLLLDPTATAQSELVRTLAAGLGRRGKPAG